MRHTDGNGRQRRVEGRWRNSELASLEIHECGDGVLIFGAGFVDVDELGADGVELGEGLRHDNLGDDAAFEQMCIEVNLILI